MDERNFGIVEVSEQAVKDVRQRNVIGVELQDELTPRNSQRVIEIPRLRVLVTFAPDVADAERFGHHLDLVALSVVEHPRPMRISDRPGADRGAA